MPETAVLLVGDVLERLRELPSESVRCCVTSPPYWGLRDYGVEGQIGLESTPEEYIDKLTAVFREVRRVLTDDGTLWLNIGDCYAGSGKGGNPEAGTKQGTNRGSQSVGVLYDGAGGKKSQAAVPNPVARNVGQTARDAAVTNVSRRLTKGAYKPKDLIGIPFMLAFALRDDGWWWRAPIIWSKPNPMPGSQRDRPTISHEYLWLMSKSLRYYYDADAIAEDVVSAKGNARSFRGGGAYVKRQTFDNSAVVERETHGNTANVSGKRTKRSVWEITPRPFRGAHFATFPPALVEPCVLAGSAPGDIVLDTFAGSCTTAIVALRHDRSFIGTELSRPYSEIAVGRVRESGHDLIIL